MAWLWSSWDEYVEFVQPVAIRGRGCYNVIKHGSRFEADRRLVDAARELLSAVNTLARLGFDRDRDMPVPEGAATWERVREEVSKIVNAGEELLLLHKRLAKSDAAYGFLHQHEILSEWERYATSGGLLYEVTQLVKDTRELIRGYDALKEANEQFLVSDLKFPPELEADFRTARDLFSVGFDDVGILIAGRGLEGVLRKIALMRKVMIEVKGRVEPASDADLRDLIEVMYRLQWKVSGHRLISKETMALLQYLRTLRNAGAHSSPQGRPPAIVPRESAAVVTETAKRLWQEVTGTRARFVTTTVQKTW
jgi:hypothetical protein